MSIQEGGMHDDSVSTSLNDNDETDDNVKLNFERHLDIQE